MHIARMLYIDPGTGSMLFTLFIGIVTTAYFFLRQVLIKLKFVAHGGGGRAARDAGKLDYVIFSDSKRYWNVFKPVCDEFERRGIPVSYWTASPDDPALGESYRHVNCEFIGEENKAFARLNMMRAWVCLSTTPGLDVYQWKRSRETDWYVHTLHAVGSAAGYRMFGIDYFDTMLLSGQFQVDEVRELERKRRLPAKEVELVGCTYLDVMAERLQREGRVQTQRTTVLLAPSWGPDAILSVYGERIISALVATGFDVIIRPHPQSMTSERKMIDALMAQFPNSEHLSWNFDNDNFDVLNRADVMISDFSGVVFDYALVFDKPIIYTEGRFDDAAYDAAWLDEPLWKFSVYPTLGIPLSEEQFPTMREVIVKAMFDRGLREGRERAREQVWAHPGESARLTVDYLVHAHERLVRGEMPERTVAVQEEGVVSARHEAHAAPSTSVEAAPSREEIYEQALAELAGDAPEGEHVPSIFDSGYIRLNEESAEATASTDDEPSSHRQPEPEAQTPEEAQAVDAELHHVDEAVVPVVEEEVVEEPEVPATAEGLASPDEDEARHAPRHVATDGQSQATVAQDAMALLLAEVGSLRDELHLLHEDIEQMRAARDNGDGSDN